MLQAPPTDSESPRASSNERATPAGTARFKERFAPAFAPDHFRFANGLWLSSIGIGTYLGEPNDQDDAAYETAVTHAMTSGINVIDTAINYRAQRSERNVRRALQRFLIAGAASRDEIVVCSKGGYIPLDHTPPATREEYRHYVNREFIEPEVLRPEEIASGGHSFAPRFLLYCLAQSRQNLGLRTIDIYYLHNPGHLLTAVEPDDADGVLRAAMEALEGAVARGDIGMYGVATWDELRVEPTVRGHLSLERLVRLAEEVAGRDHHCRMVQLPVNLAYTEAVRAKTQVVGGRQATALEAASALGLTVVASAPLLQARLTQGLPPAVAEHFPAATSDAQRALSFVRSLAGVTTAVVGMKHTGHVDENLAVARVREPS